MRFSRVLRAGALVAAAGIALAGCGGGGTGGSGDGGEGGDDSITIGIKFDQPGVGQKTGANSYDGFDVDLAKFIAKELGFEEDQIEFKEAISKQREALLKAGDVDYIVGTYSITDERKKEVDFVGPYFVAHQDLLVRADDDSIDKATDLNGKKLCSVTGSTSAQNVKEEIAPKAQLKEYGGYSECLTGLENKAVDAITTDDTILAGLAAANPGKFKLAGANMSDENYGVGIAKDSKLKDKITAAVKKFIESGEWKKSAEKHLGPAGYKIPEPPTVE